VDAVDGEGTTDMIYQDRERKRASKRYYMSVSRFRVVCVSFAFESRGYGCGCKKEKVRRGDIRVLITRG
jgi:hypothetical protein